MPNQVQGQNYLPKFFAPGDSLKTFEDIVNIGPTN